MGKRGPKPKQPPCPTCHQPPICIKSPWYRCECGTFRLVNGILRPVRAKAKAATPTTKGRKMPKLKVREGVRQFQEPLTAIEVEELNGWLGWEPVEVEE